MDLLEVLGVQPGSDEAEEFYRGLEAAFARIRESERAAHLAAAQVWIT